MKLKFQKIITILLLVQMVLFNTAPLAIAEEVVSPTPSASEIQTTQETSSPPPSDTSSESSSQEQTTTPQTDTSNIANPQGDTASNTSSSSLQDEQKAWEEQQRILAEQAYHAGQQYVVPIHEAPEYQAYFGGGNVGDTAVSTGNANNSASVATNVNNNYASSPLNEGVGSAAVINSDNGSSSSNSGSASIVNDNATNQNNTGSVLSGLSGSSVTGENNNSFNVGNSDTTTGDANTTGTVITALNSNVDGVMVSEFNIVDNHVGDIILDFGTNCIAGCGTGNLSASNSGNGANSTNDANAAVNNTNNTFQNNDGTVGNSLVLSADSGNNNASYNTGGDSNITTGDANVAANMLTFLNNNIGGNVVFSVINVFGDLVGDIIFPAAQLACCGSNLSTSNTGNGAGSDNTANASLSNSNGTFQNNDATINNNLVFNATTGDNSSSFNTGGNSTISTGQANVDANVLNIANNNILGGNMWLVLINHAGNWIGKIIGAPEGSSYAGSEGLEFSIGPSGQVLAANSGNGANSINNAGTTVSNTDTTTQNNTANVTNTLNLRANTGGNDTKFNTGGDSTIQTGDANIIANLVNFVNNNIVGGGKLFVTVVNVFGSWTGDFVSPGQEKQKTVNNSQPASPAGRLTVNNKDNNTNLGSHSSNPSIPSNSSASNNSPITPTSPNNPNLPNATSVTSLTGNASSTFSLNNFANNISTGSMNGAPENGLLASSKVAGVSAKNMDAQTKKININLGWLVVILPLLATGLIVRKMILRRL